MNLKNSFNWTSSCRSFDSYAAHYCRTFVGDVASLGYEPNQIMSSGLQERLKEKKKDKKKRKKDHVSIDRDLGPDLSTGTRDDLHTTTAKDLKRCCFGKIWTNLRSIETERERERKRGRERDEIPGSP